MQFAKILAALAIQTPEGFLDAISNFETSGASSSQFLTKNPESAALFAQLTWSGKMAASNVIKTVVTNQDWDN